jgi:hypothetical protein
VFEGFSFDFKPLHLKSDFRPNKIQSYNNIKQLKLKFYN